MQARAELPAGRGAEGVLIVDAPDGEKQFRCLGRSDRAAATKKGNPTRDPLRTFGDLPTGVYQATREPPKPASPANVRTYGAGPVWRLIPLSGQALDAATGSSKRSGFLMHGGATGAPMPANALRPTNGCLRVDDSTCAWFDSSGIRSFTLTVVEV